MKFVNRLNVSALDVNILESLSHQFKLYTALSCISEKNIGSIWVSVFTLLLYRPLLLFGFNQINK